MPSTETSSGVILRDKQSVSQNMSEILLSRFLHILIVDNCRFGGSFPAQRVKTAISFFTTFAISFPVGSLGEEFGWRGVMAPYITLLLDRRFGAGRTWKWTPLLQSLLTGIVWAVRGFLSCCIVFFAVAAV